MKIPPFPAENDDKEKLAEATPSSDAQENSVDKVAAMKSIFGAIPPDADLDEAKSARLQPS